VRLLYQRQFAGERLKGPEAALLKRWERVERERLRWESLRAVPKKDYVAMSGRQQKILDQQGERYGLDELLKPKIDVTRLVRQLHDLLAKHWLKFSAEASEADLMKGGGNSPALERYRQAKAEREELELSIKRGEVVPLLELGPRLVALAEMGRSRFEAMERAGGPSVRREIETLIDDWVEQVKRWYPEAGEGEGIVETPEMGKEQK
jgi:hypothetical protein